MLLTDRIKEIQKLDKEDAWGFRVQDYENWVAQKSNAPNQTRIRPDDQNIFDALMEVELPEDVITAIRNLK